MTWAKLFVFATIGAFLIYYQPNPSGGTWPLVLFVAAIISLTILLCELGSSLGLFKRSG